MNTWLTGAGTLAIAVAYAYHTGYVHGTDKTTADWTAEKLALATQQRTKEAELQSNMDTLRKAYSDETSRLSRTIVTLNDRMRNRPERPASATMPASAASSPVATSTGCTGAELYRSDGEFLIRFAARAEAIRIAMIQCQDAYRQVQGN